MIGANEKLAVSDGKRGVGLFPKRVGGEQLEAWAGAKNKSVAPLVHGVASPFREDDRRPVLAGRTRTFEPLFLNPLPGLELETFGDAGIIQNVDVPLMDDAGSNPLFRPRMMPQPMGGGDVTGPARFHGQRAPAKTAHCHHDSVRKKW